MMGKTTSHCDILVKLGEGGGTPLISLTDTRETYLMLVENPR